MNCSSVNFESATEKFYSMDYASGLEEIDRCIENNPSSSIMFGNRALFYIQTGQLEYAYEDLVHSLELNHLNYIAYFNMFSLLIRE